MNPPRYAEGQGDAELDAMLAVSEDRLLNAIQASLDLDAGLAEIIGVPPRPGAADGKDELAIGTGGRLPRIEGASAAEVSAGRIRADSAEGRYLAGPGEPLYLQVSYLQAKVAFEGTRARAPQGALERVQSEVAQTRAFRSLLAALRASWKHRRYVAAGVRLAAIQTRSEEARDRLQQDFLNFLLKTEGLPFGLAQLRAVALLETVDNGNAPGLPAEASTPSQARPAAPGTAYPRERRRVRASLAAAVAVALIAVAAVTGLVSAFPGAHGHLAGDTRNTLPAPTSGAVDGYEGTLPAFSLRFGPGQSQLSDSAKATLRSWLAENAWIKSATPLIEITGYGDTGAAAPQNAELSLQRARAIAAYLADQGVPAFFMTAMGAGNPGQSQALNGLAFLYLMGVYSSG